MTEQSIYHRNFLLHLQERPGHDGPVLLKEPAHGQLTDSQIGQLHNEYAISRQLDDVSGVRAAYSLEGSESQPVLVLKYIQGHNLAEISQKQALNLRQKLQLAVEVATILGRIHDAGVMHRDISSGNIMVAEGAEPDEPGAVIIIDFGLATTLRGDELAQPIAPDVVAGTLAYISPEQTGRMNRAVDYRSDLYSLGVTLYELFTGQMPFQTGDSMEMIHAHIAIQPIPPHEHNDEIPEMLSEIILKLMAKNAEDRYQSARGLGADLDWCLDQLRSTGSIEPFALGQDDFSGRLQIPQKLYGREAELKQLADTYARVAQGNTELLYIAGYSGVGKTALVHEVRREVLMRQGRFIEGKFDQLQRTLPYSAWEQAFTQLVNNWLVDSETNLARWREITLEAVGDNGQILIDVIPALERIIGPQPEVPQLGGLENQNRFNYYFNRFISSLATLETPLVVFLDDLQWIDPASLSLIESLLAVQSDSSLLVIGAYRDNEVGTDHPLVASQGRMSRDADWLRIITLADLKSADIDHLLADSLQLAVADCRDLSQALREKTAGNPFYFRQQLYALEAEELLSFDRDQRRWVWEEELQHSLEAGGNVVDLMIKKIQTLPVETQETLSTAAIIGSRFELSTLDTVSGRSQTAILSDLNPALQSGLILRSNGYFAFAHDRVQEVGYSLIPQAELPSRHLEIGRLLMANATDEELEEEIFDIVGHLNAGRELITAESEKLDLVNLNLKAGQKARAASAFSDAKTHFEIALALLGPESWKRQYELTLSLYNEYGEVTSYLGQYDQLTAIVDLIHANARDIIDRIRIYMVQINAASATWDFGLAVDIGLQILDQLGIKIPAQPGPEDYKRLQTRYLELLKGNPREVIAGLPKMTDEKALAASTAIISIMTATFATRPDVFAFIGFTGGILTLEHGVFPWSPHFFGQLGSILWVVEDHGTPADHVLDSLLWFKQIQEVVLDMVEDPFFKPSSARALEGVYHNGAYCRPIEENIEVARRALYTGFEVGDLLFAAHGPFFIAMYEFVSGKNLDEFRSQMIEYIQLLGEVNQTVFASWVAMYLQAGLNLMEPAEEPQRLIGSYFDEDAYLSAAEAANDISGRHFFYAARLMVTYHFDVDGDLSELITESEKFIHAGQGLITTAITRIYSAFSKLRLYPTLSPEDQEDAMHIVDHCLQLMAIWSQSAPGTFRHMYDLIKAEEARVLSDTDSAISHYERAIEGAREVGFTNDEALANELYSRFWQERDNVRFAGQFMREAHSLYRKWGALAKAEHLEKRYPNWLVTKRIILDESGKVTAAGQLSGDLDILTVLKASQAIAGEIEQARLLELLMNTTIENSGAQSGYLLLPDSGGWMIAAQADIDDSRPQVGQSISITDSNRLSQGVVNYVARTQQTVLLDEAMEDGAYNDDPHIQRNEVKSLLCTPLVNQGKISAILYLENNLSPGVFTSDRVALLNLLSSQMAISVDNARLLEERAQALRSAETQIRLLFENSPIGIALSTYRGEILTFNKALLDMLRISEEELLREGAANFYANSSDRAKLLAAVQESGSVQEFGLPLVRRDGDLFFGSINMSRLILEGNEVLLTMVEDVTDEITAEQQTAAIEERERLARELHDAVSQTLFSAGMIADATPTLWEKDPATGRQNLEMLSTMIRGASAEMRSLLLELRPDTLRDQTLGRLLETLAVAARARSQAEVTLTVEGDCQIPDDVTLALHRIAQESLNNVAKHAQASEIRIGLHCSSQSVELRIKDDGRGFDPQAILAGHLGVGIMRERADKIGASLQINSKLGDGTSVDVSWSEDGSI